MRKQAHKNERGSGGALILGLVASLALLALPTTAMGAAGFTIPSYKISSDLPAFGAPPGTVPSDGPSALQAGGNPDAGSYTSFAFSPTPTTEDVKTAVTNFGAGLLGNPTSVPLCSEEDLQSPNFGATCPTGSAIGTSRLDIGCASGAAGGVAISGIAGTVYNAAPLGSEPGRLGIVTPAGFTTLVSSIPFTITPRGNGDYGLTGTLDDINRLTTVPGISGTCGDSNAVVKGLSFLLNGATNAYVRNPTSCSVNTSTGYAVGWDDPTQVDGPAYTFTPTGCESVPFNPSAEVTVGDKGSVKTQKFPPVVVKIKNQSDNADIKGQTLLLPEELNTNNTAYNLCTQAQADSDSCPANSKFGWGTATSPFLSQQVQGPVYLIQQTSSSLPGLLIDLQGLAHVKIQTSTVLVDNKKIQSVVTNAPQLPVSELSVALNGGRDTGVFQNRSSLCFDGDDTSKFKDLMAPATFTGWNGTGVSQTVNAVVNGCGPGVTGKITKGYTRMPKLNLLGFKHPDNKNIKELKIKLPKTMRFVKKRITKGTVGRTGGPKSSLKGSKNFSATSRTLKVKGLDSTGVDAIRTYVRKGAIRMTNKMWRILRRGKSHNFKINVTQVPTSGDTTATTATVKAKGKKR